MKIVCILKRYAGLILPVAFYLVLMAVGTAYAGEKAWSGSGDATTWSDDDNWSTGSAPAVADDAIIDAEGAAVVADRTFNAKSLSVGERSSATLTIPNFIYGTVEPASGSDNAIVNGQNGKITLGGTGTITVTGRYKDSEETAISEPSFIFWVE